MTDLYYIGIVAYRGMEYPGRHPALVTPEVFDQVQRVLAAHRQSGERYRRHNHYLKGSLFCARCKSRMSVCASRGNGGVYTYFFCLGRHTRRTTCALPYLAPEDVEEAVERHWQGVQLDSEIVEQVRAELLADLRREQEQAGQLKREVQNRIGQIESKRRVWAEKVASGSIPDDIGREKQNELTRQLVRSRHDLAELEAASADVEQTLNEALDLVRDCATAYRNAAPALRREWNQGFFERIEIDAEEGAGVSSVKLKPPFDTLLDPKHTPIYQRPKSTRPPQRRHTAPRMGSRMVAPEALPVGLGSNKSTLVELRGFEPLTPLHAIQGSPSRRAPRNLA
jgi:hypothetical protein